MAIFCRRFSYRLVELALLDAIRLETSVVRFENFPAITSRPIILFPITLSALISPAKIALPSVSNVITGEDADEVAVEVEIFVLALSENRIPLSVNSSCRPSSFTPESLFVNTSSAYSVGVITSSPATTLSVNTSDIDVLAIISFLSCIISARIALLISLAILLFPGITEISNPAN